MEKLLHFIVEGDGISRRRKVLSPDEELHRRVLALIAEWKKTKPGRRLTYAEGYSLAKEEGRKQVTFKEPGANEGKEVVGIELHQRVREFMAESAKNGKVISYTEAYPIVRKQVAEEKEGGIYG